MVVRQQIIQDRTDTLATHLGIDADTAFLRLAHSLITGKSVHMFDPDDLVDGGQDKQLDTITIEEDGEGADIYILQTKNTATFSSNALIQLHNGLRWLFEKPRAEFKTLSNKPLRDKIVEYRTILSSLGPSNLRIHVRFVTNGPTALFPMSFAKSSRAFAMRIATTRFSSSPLNQSEPTSSLSCRKFRNRRRVALTPISKFATTPTHHHSFGTSHKG